MRNSFVKLLMIFTSLFLSQPVTAADTELTRVIQDGDIEIEAFVYGEGLETLIIAAGNGRPASQLEELARNIATSGVQVVTYNYRSIGGSKGPIDNVTLLDLADDVWRIADAMKLKKVHLAGKTYGNRVMRAAASAQPGRTLSITLIGAGGEILPSEEVQVLYYRYIDPKTSEEEWLKLQGELMFAPGNEYLASRSAELGSFPALAEAQMKASNATSRSEWANGGTAPMLILSCLMDRVAVPENALSLAKSRPDTWMVGIPGCGHNMLYERQRDITRLMVEFIFAHAAADGT